MLLHRPKKTFRKGKNEVAGRCNEARTVGVFYDARRLDLPDHLCGAFGNTDLLCRRLFRQGAGGSAIVFSVSPVVVRFFDFRRVHAHVGGRAAQRDDRAVDDFAAFDGGSGIGQVFCRLDIRRRGVGFDVSDLVDRQLFGKPRQRRHSDELFGQFFDRGNLPVRRVMPVRVYEKPDRRFCFNDDGVHTSDVFRL